MGPFISIGGIIFASLSISTGKVLSIVAEGFAYDDLAVPGMRKGAPTKLDGRLILDDSRLTVSNYMVGNIQVFGRELSKEEMVSITVGKDFGRT